MKGLICKMQCCLLNSRQIIWLGGARLGAPKRKVTGRWRPWSLRLISSDKEGGWLRLSPDPQHMSWLFFFFSWNQLWNKHCLSWGSIFQHGRTWMEWEIFLIFMKHKAKEREWISKGNLVSNLSVEEQIPSVFFSLHLALLLFWAAHQHWASRDV